MKRIVITLMLLLVFSGLAVFSESSVWTVSNSDTKLFIGGTIHILSQSDFPLPDEFEEAYQEAEVVVFETDIAGLQTPEAQAQLIQKVSFQDGTTLQDVLSGESFASVEHYFAEWGVPMDELVHFRPSFIVVTITALELQRLGIDSGGVDFYFAGRVYQDQKESGYLETIEQQIEFVANMGSGMEDELIDSTWKDIAQLPVLMDTMMSAWRTGDSSVLEEVFTTDMRKEFPEVYQEIIVQRNNAWMPQIESMLETAETELVLVGTAHLVGEDGLLAQLAGKGYVVSQY